MRTLTTLLFLSLAGCPGSMIQVTEITDEGTLCLTTDGQLLVDFQTCLGGCDTLVEATCEAVLEEGVLVVTSYGRIETDVSPGIACTEECRQSAATCDLPLIEDPSTVTVEHGENTIGLGDIPECSM